MPRGLVAVLAFLLCCSAALAQGEATSEEAPDPWLGCWSKVYDAGHLAKHPGQKVSSMTLSIGAREEESSDAPGAYLAKVTALMRDKPDIYSNLDGARCIARGRRLACFTDGFFVGRFSLEPAGKDMKLTFREDEHLALVPGVDIAAFTVLSAKNPEHALFLLNPAPAKTCGQ